MGWQTLTAFLRISTHPRVFPAPLTGRYAELTRWLGSPAAPDERFAATLHLHALLRGGEVPDSDETVEALVRFWSGDPMRTPDLRRALKAAGAAGLFSLGPVPARELARQRWAFTARLLKAAGHAGWVVLFDEVELIGRYSVLQRGRPSSARLHGAAASAQVNSASTSIAAVHGSSTATRPPLRPISR